MKKNLPPDKYNVAWFKLAECVARGEKERALGVYRLLSHSFEDEAFSCQLAGDILCAFDDVPNALEKYKQAVDLYRKEERLLEAAAVSENMLVLSVHKIEPLKNLVLLYRELGAVKKVVSYLEMLFTLLLERKDLDGAAVTLEQLDDCQAIIQTASFREQLIFAMLDEKGAPTFMVMKQVKQLVDDLIDAKNQKLLQKFMTKLEAMHEECYEQAREYLDHG